MDQFKKFATSPYTISVAAILVTVVFFAIVFVCVSSVQSYRYESAVFAAQQGDETALMGWRDRNAPEDYESDRRVIERPRWFDGRRIEGVAAAMKAMSFALMFMAVGIYLVMLAVAKGLEKIIGSAF